MRPLSEWTEQLLPLPWAPAHPTRSVLKPAYVSFKLVWHVHTKRGEGGAQSISVGEVQRLDELLEESLLIASSGPPRGQQALHTLSHMWSGTSAKLTTSKSWNRSCLAR